MTNITIYGKIVLLINGRLIILVIKKVITLFLSLIMSVNLSLTVFAEEEVYNEDFLDEGIWGEEISDEEFLDEEIAGEDYKNEPCTPFVLMASDENGGINISCSKVEFFGDISSAKYINIWASDIKENGLRMENDTSFVIDSFRNNLENFKYNDLSNVYISLNNSVEENPIKCNVYSNSSSEININSIIYSKNNIDLSAQYIIANGDNDQYLFSEKGNININCENFDFSGIIYAPNGNVNISANKININGFVFAKNITLNASEVLIKENYDLFEIYENLQAKEQEKTNQLIKDYMKTVDEINNIEGTTTEEYEELENQYEDLHAQIEEKDMFLSDEEAKEFFENEYEKVSSEESTATTNKAKARKAFKPCNGMESMYNVIRETGVAAYKKKNYSYYSMIVCDKANTKPAKMKFYKRWAQNVTVTGQIRDISKAKNYLNSAFQVTFGKGAGKVLSSLGRPIAGALVSKALSKIYPFGKPTAADLVVTGESLHTADMIRVSTRMRYYWVKYNGSWQYSYACNFAVWKLRHTFYKYNKKIRDYNYKDKMETIDLDGNFFKPPYAVKAVVDYKALHGKNSNNGYYPFGWNKTPDLIITDYKGKKHTYKTPFFATTISLM